jgi:hypothetical protein
MPFVRLNEKAAKEALIRAQQRLEREAEEWRRQQAAREQRAAEARAEAETGDER